MFLIATHGDRSTDYYVVVLFVYVAAIAAAAGAIGSRRKVRLV